MTLQKLLSMVCNYFDVDVKMVKSRSRNQHYVYPRHVYCYLARKYSKHSLSEIGQLIDRNHDSVIHAVNLTKSHIEIYPNVHKDILNLEKEIELPPDFVIKDVDLLALTINYTKSFLL